jgi:hypothetical protein
MDFPPPVMRRFIVPIQADLCLFEQRRRGPKKNSVCLEKVDQVCRLRFRPTVELILDQGTIDE